MNAEIKPTVDLVNIEVDGRPMQAPKGSMIIEATDRAGVEIPRFCYHPKLSIAANCRMCLVDVEKMPKPVPACATPVMEGMRIYTGSRRAVDAQHGVMEFLLINHPLDCPICDQGGECELQDLAMGYGRSVSRFSERKRVVRDKNVGPLVQTEMTRCIHCTRCVRFLEEIAGTSEMGGGGRGDRLEIGTLVQNSIDSELSGNVIDLCPVGALTNKPFRFSARAWELVARPSLAAHDGIGSNLWYHVRNGRVLRSVPRDNEAVNETWLADRDRYSHFGLYAEDRVLQPQVKEDGEWRNVSWDDAIGRAVALLREGIDRHGPEKLGLLMSPSAATEEYFLAQALLRGLGSNNIDHRLRQRDFADDAACPPRPDFEMGLASIAGCDAALLIGSNPRQEAPILGHRLRQAWTRGARISVVNPLDWDFVFATDLDAIVPPQGMVAELATLAVAVAGVTGVALPGHLAAAASAAQPQERHQALARRLHESQNGLLLVGQFAMAHAQASWLRSLAAWMARASGCALNVMPHGGNPAGAWQAGALPHRGPGGSAVTAGLNAAQMLQEGLGSCILWDVEPDHDIDDPAAAMRSLAAADNIIAVATFAGPGLRELADVILPLAPLAESEGSLVNFEGLVQPFSAAGKALGEARSGWRILRKLGGALGLAGLDQVDLEGVRADLQSALGGATAVAPVACELPAPVSAEGLYRVGEVAMYSIDALCRRAAPLQQTAQALDTVLRLNAGDAERLGLADGARVRVHQGEQSAEIELRVDGRVPAGAAWLRSGIAESRSLGPAVGPVTVEKA